MRQLGFVPEPARNSRGIDTSIPAIGLKVYNSGNGKARASFPYCVRQDMRSGAVTVYCPLLPDGSLPYWRALIEFARLSGSEGFPDSCKRANGMALKRMLHGIVPRHRATGRNSSSSTPTAASGRETGGPASATPASSRDP